MLSLLINKVLGPTIREKGHSIQVQCDTCSETFQTQEGVISIKGQHGTETTCPKCKTIKWNDWQNRIR